MVVALLRGVNVGGNNKIKMDALRAICAELGHSDVQTYVQSGNVVFSTKQKDLAKIAKGLEDAIEKQAGFRPAVILRDASELRSVVARNPFAGRDGIEPGKLVVTFLPSQPAAGAREALAKVKAPDEELHLDGRELYIYFRNGIGNSKISWTQVDKALGMSGTGRNWNSVTKLLEMAGGF